ncbi:MAG: hypothetical protein M0D57_06550 [Sphingobacteriales bacterium JAD_PAG50586_3]|nr:MAG: hypothetical protein M0D57_06550 [Sphingobacteriales bacterium JAD_PAG50586_3]
MSTTNQDKDNKGSEQEKQFPGYPPYPKSEDIYAQGERDETINPDDKSKIVEQKEEQPYERAPEGEYDGGDLDVPGAELDDADEAIGREDEENNYYSLGGDNHNDLEEDQATGLD